MESYEMEEEQMSLDQKYNESHFMYENCTLYTYRSLLQCLEDIEKIDERN